MEHTSVDEWVNFFRDAGIPPDVSATYASSFFQNRVQFDMVLDLNRDLLRELGVTLIGDAISILRHAKSFHEQRICQKIFKSVSPECHNHRPAGFSNRIIPPSDVAPVAPNLRLEGGNGSRTASPARNHQSNVAVVSGHSLHINNQEIQDVRHEVQHDGARYSLQEQRNSTDSSPLITPSQADSGTLNSIFAGSLYRSDITPHGLLQLPHPRYCDMVKPPIGQTEAADNMSSSSMALEILSNGQAHKKLLMREHAESRITVPSRQSDVAVSVDSVDSLRDYIYKTNGGLKQQAKHAPYSINVASSKEPAIRLLDCNTNTVMRASIPDMYSEVPVSAKAKRSKTLSNLRSEEQGHVALDIHSPPIVTESAKNFAYETRSTSRKTHSGETQAQESSELSISLLGQSLSSGRKYDGTRGENVAEMHSPLTLQCQLSSQKIQQRQKVPQLQDQVHSEFGHEKTMKSKPLSELQLKFQMLSELQLQSQAASQSPLPSQVATQSHLLSQVTSRAPSQNGLLSQVLYSRASPQKAPKSEILSPEAPETQIENQNVSQSSRLQLNCESTSGQSEPLQQQQSLSDTCTTLQSRNLELDQGRPAESHCVMKNSPPVVKRVKKKVKFQPMATILNSATQLQLSGQCSQENDELDNVGPDKLPSDADELVHNNKRKKIMKSILVSDGENQKSWTALKTEAGGHLVSMGTDRSPDIWEAHQQHATIARPSTSTCVCGNVPCSCNTTQEWNLQYGHNTENDLQLERVRGQVFSRLGGKIHTMSSDESPNTEPATNVDLMSVKHITKKPKKLRQSVVLTQTYKNVQQKGIAKRKILLRPLRKAAMREMRSGGTGNSLQRTQMASKPRGILKTSTVLSVQQHQQRKEQQQKSRQPRQLQQTRSQRMTANLLLQSVSGTTSANSDIASNLQNIVQFEGGSSVDPDNSIEENNVANQQNDCFSNNTTEQPSRDLPGVLNVSKTVRFGPVSVKEYMKNMPTMSSATIVSSSRPPVFSRLGAMWK